MFTFLDFNFKISNLTTGNYRNVTQGWQKTLWLKKIFWAAKRTAPNDELPYLFTLRSRVFTEKPTGSQLVKKFPAFYEKLKFITAFTTANHLSISRSRSTQSMPPSHFVNIYLNIILPSAPGSANCPLSLKFPTKTLYTPLIPSTCATYYAQLIRCIAWNIVFAIGNKTHSNYLLHRVGIAHSAE